tara:strand:+ start:544 stop:744 length:201 start_codon:yes stop_codon:yes gene_type:complete
MQTQPYFALHDVVRLTTKAGVHSNTVKGTIIGRSYGVPMRFDIETETGLVNDVTAENLEPWVRGGE